MLINYQLLNRAVAQQIRQATDNIFNYYVVASETVGGWYNVAILKYSTAWRFSMIQKKSCI